MTKKGPKHYISLGTYGECLLIPVEMLPEILNSSYLIETNFSAEIKAVKPASTIKGQFFSQEDVDQILVQQSLAGDE